MSRYQNDHPSDSTGIESVTQPDDHYHHLFNNLPSWVIEASSDTRRALKSTTLATPGWHGTATSLQHQSLKHLSQEHWTHRNRLDSMLSKLQSAQAFAEPLLSAALKARFGLELDVRTTFLRLYIPQTVPWFGINTGAARTWTLSLLDAALHNFQESETADDAYESASTFITKPSPTGQFDTLPAVKQKLSVAAFVLLCRNLDIGARYNTYLKDNLGLTNPVAGAALKSKVTSSQKAALKSALKMAHIRKDIAADAHLSILRILEGRSGARLDGQPLYGHDLTIMSSSLTGIVIFAASLERARKGTRIIAYIPDDPEHPIKEYPNTLAFMTELTRKLRAPAYQTFFSRFVDHKERGYFFADLNRRLQSVTWHQHKRGDPLPSWRETPVDRPDLRFSTTPFSADLWNHLYQRQLNKILNDSSTLAVSTATADRNARWSLWDAFSKVASTLLEIAAFVAMPFVPFLGELMLGYMAYQLLDETFEGIVDLAEGLKTEALGHLLTLVETVVQVGTFAVGGAIAAGTFSRLLSREAVALVNPLKPVAAPEGKTRYWKPDLTPYEQAPTLPESAKPDQLGLYRHGGKTLLPLEGKLYAVKSDGTSGAFQIEHPTRSHAYQPSLLHNSHGAWHTELEQPLSWDRETVMRRLGESVKSFSGAEREQILRVSGFHDNAVREMHVEQYRPPSLLADTIKRFRINRDIETFIEQIGSDQSERYQMADVTLQHQLLSGYDSWPADTPMPPPQTQMPAFRQQTAELARKYRKSLFDLRYRALEKTGDPGVQRLLDDVHGLPTDIAGELASNASGTELKQLHNGRTPQRLKDAALKAMEAVRATRACEGFYSEALDSADTHRLALQSLNSLPDLPAGLRIEVRDYSATGTLRDSIGEPDAPILETLIRAENGTYQVQQDNDSVPGDFYQALFQALPEAQRNKLSPAIADARALKQRIAEHALEQPALRTLFAKNPNRKPLYDPTTMRLPGGTQGYSRLNRVTPTLDDRVREVFPSLPQEELQSIVRSLQLHPDGARVELSRLNRELARLHQELLTWANETPTVHPETRHPLSELEQQAETNNRRLLAQEIQRSWRRQSDRDFDTPEGVSQYVLRFAEPIIGDFPSLSADFSHVSLLSLEGTRSEQGIPTFLQGFKGLRRLELRRFSLTTLPDAISRMPDLHALVLSDCGIRVDAAVWSKLTSLKKLAMLDLYKNPFETLPRVDTMSELTHLDLSDTHLTAIPASALQHPKLDTLLLMNNRISELPAELFESSLYDKRGVHLTHNPLSIKGRELIKQHHFETAYDMGVFAPEPDIDRVMTLYPGMEVEQASQFVYELPGTLEDGRTYLTRLEDELTQLRNDLSAWTADVPDRHPVTGEPFSADQLFAEQVSRDEFKQALEKCWQHDSDLDDFNEALEPTFELIVRSIIHGELPSLSADFSHVSTLEVHSADGATRIGRFLELFPNLKRLRLRECDVGNIPDSVFKMGRLRSLSLPHCRVRLSTASVNALAGMEQLDYLDLSHNSLGYTPDLSQMTELSTVLLNDTGITQIPNGLFQLTDLEWADLSTNAIADIPSDLMELPIETAENITLRGNPFSEESLLRLISYYEGTSADFGVEEVINRGEMQVSTSEGSEIDE
ncbi:dermonecrotic toxin domain-containing protein [Pseudomonas sp.]|uniref:dermonecrotic toxin domain-containing protein n=1 Tax=Pseudomonas sp. TaxID=306 RepID=UPI003F2FD309